MPLSPPAPRRDANSRTIVCHGYLRDDNLWDIAYEFKGRWRIVAAGEHAHDMSLRWTVGDDLVIRAIEVVTDASPYPPLCPSATVHYQRLVGLNVGKGFIREVQNRVARTDGCTHIFALIQAAANATMQTISGRYWMEGGGNHSFMDVFGHQDGRPGLLDTCTAYAAHNPVVKMLWPRYYTGPDSGQPETE